MSHLTYIIYVCVYSLSDTNHGGACAGYTAGIKDGQTSDNRQRARLLSQHAVQKGCVEQTKKLRISSLSTAVVASPLSSLLGKKFTTANADDTTPPAGNE